MPLKDAAQATRLSLAVTLVDASDGIAERVKALPWRTRVQETVLD